MLQETGGVEAPPPPELGEYHEQTVEWVDCGRDQECATVRVPIDYANPGDGDLDIHLKKYALASAEGIVLVNPGGPGGSGIEMIDYAPQIFSSRLRAEREIVGFDPRGVGESAPISCFDDAELDEWYTTLYDVETAEGWEDLLAAFDGYFAACERNNADLLGFVDTVSAARDMDIIRGALGLEQLDYLGFSYGTKLGATYAELFGPNVGRFVLDSAMDLSLTAEELALGQLQGFERAYRAYLDDCLTGPACPFHGSVEEAYEDTVLLVEQLTQRPANSGDPDRPVTEADLLNAIVVSLYSTDNWMLLTSALTALQQGDGGQVKFLSDFAIERDPAGQYPPSDGAALAINCLDMPHTDPLDLPALLQEAEEYEEISPLFGQVLGFGQVACSRFPIKTQFGPHAASAPEAPTVVVIGVTGDPATPYDWSLAMAEQLTDAVHVTWEAEGHTAYGTSTGINNAVDAVLSDGQLAEDGLRC